jgi:uncharacterized protein YkwD
MGAMKKRRVLLALIVFALLPAAPAAARSAARRPPRAVRAAPRSATRRAPAAAAPVADAQPRLLGLINRDRAAAGLAPLQADGGARGFADRWSRQMAQAGGLSHNHEYLNVGSLQRLHATLAGENVAVGSSSLEQIHRLFMQSPQHRANVLHPDFRLVGLAAVRTPAGLLYVTEDFLRRE